MSKNLLEIDSAFTHQYRGLLEIQHSIKNQLSVYEFDLSEPEITNAIIERMMAFWYFNVNNNKEILGREINTTSADFFTETCLLFLKCYFEKTQGLKVRSEKNIAKGFVIRPDISIWNEDETILYAAIELKVSDGWKGETMLTHLEVRENQIKSLFHNAYFGVLDFWNFFSSDTSGWNSKYFGLLQFDKNNNYQRTDASVENLILKINKKI